MTVSYKKSGVGGGQYYVDCMTADGSRAVDDYYTGSAKEPPGRWYAGPDADGSRASTLGIVDGLEFGAIEGRENVERFATLVQGFSPEDGHPLVQNAGEAARIAIHDWTASAPKSVSVIWAQADAPLKVRIEAAQEAGAREMLDFLSKHSFTRRGKGGVDKVPGGGGGGEGGGGVL
jgi:hypothetical protein